MCEWWAAANGQHLGYTYRNKITNMYNGYRFEFYKNDQNTDLKFFAPNYVAEISVKNDMDFSGGTVKDMQKKSMLSEYLISSSKKVLQLFLVVSRL